MSVAPIQSPLRVTLAAAGADRRKVTRPSAAASGDLTRACACTGFGVGWAVAIETPPKSIAARTNVKTSCLIVPSLADVRACGRDDGITERRRSRIKSSHALHHGDELGGGPGSSG